MDVCSGWCGGGGVDLHPQIAGTDCYFVLIHSNNVFAICLFGNGYVCALFTLQNTSHTRSATRASDMWDCCRTTALYLVRARARNSICRLTHTLKKALAIAGGGVVQSSRAVLDRRGAAQCGFSTRRFPRRFGFFFGGGHIKLRDSHRIHTRVRDDTTMAATSVYLIVLIATATHTHTYQRTLRNL